MMDWNSKDAGQELMDKAGFSQKERSVPSPYLPFEDAHLETPLFTCVPRRFFSFRNWVLKPFRRPVVRIRGLEITIGGIFFYLAIYAFFLSRGALNYFAEYKTVTKKIHETGDAVAAAVCFLFSIAGRNSIWTLILGVTYERAVIWHRVASGASLLLVLVHGYVAWNAESLQFWVGLGMASLFGFVALTSHFLIFLNLYRTFLIIHRLAIAALLVLFVVHGATPAIAGGVLYLGDLIVRLWISARLKEKIKVVDAKASPEGFVTLSFPRQSFKYAPGQFLFVGVPAISLWEAHPFSICSSPFQETVTLHIRPLGDWTSALERLVRAEQKLEVTLQGPYGNALTEFEDVDRPTYLFLGGGIGVTPLLSMANHLLFQKFRGKPLEKIYFCWSFREPGLPALTLGAEEFLFSFPERLGQFRGTPTPRASKDLVHLDLYCTQGDTSVLPSSLKRYLRPGHLNISEIFRTVDLERKGRPERSVFVVCCGPESMGAEVSRLSKAHGFAHHIEAFSY